MWKVSILIILALALSWSQAQNLLQQVCTADRMYTDIEPNATVVLGGIFELRGQGINDTGCGRPVEYAMQVFEAARYSVNLLNSFNSGNGYIQGVTFGMRAYDVCQSPNLAVNALQMLYPQTTSSNVYCAAVNSQIITGTVGAQSSDVTLALAKRAAQIPASVISPSAESPELSDKFMYPTFLRTTPSLVIFAKATVELLHQLQWENVLVIYIDSAYGRSGYQQLLQATYKAGLCVFQALALTPGSTKDGFKATLNSFGFTNSTAAVLVASHADAKLILQAVDEIPQLNSIQWIVSDFDLSRDASSLRRTHGIIYVSPRSSPITEFQQYFTTRLADPRNNVGNPWFKDWFEEVYGCSLTGTTNACQVQSQPTYSSQFVQNTYVVATMKAVFAYAETVRSICGGSGVCASLRSMDPSEFHRRLMAIDFTFPSTFPITALRGQKIKFDSNGDLENTDYTIFNYNNRQGNYVFEEIGSYVSNVLTLNRSPTLYDAATRSSILNTNPTAKCAVIGCSYCLMPQSSVTYRYTFGDIVIGSLISGHNLGTGPFICGQGDTTRLASLVAAEWAVSRFKIANPTKLQGVSLGSLVADICPDSIIPQVFLNDLLSGNNRLRDKSGAVIPYKNIVAFVDQSDSFQTKVFGPILSKYMIPQLESTATSVDLKSSGLNSYFSRAIPNDEVYATAVSSLLLKMGWKYVQIATGSKGYWPEMTKTYVRVAARYGICVASIAYLDETDLHPYNKTLNQLLSYNETQIVIVLGDATYVKGLLTAIALRGVAGQLQLVSGNDRFNRNPSFFQGVGEAAVGTIVTDLELAENVEFKNYLAGLNLTQIAANPFLRELFEMINMCSLDPSTRGLYNRTCSSSDSYNIYQDKTAFVIECVYAVANKLHELIGEVCNTTQYTSLCPDFLSATDIGSRLNMKLQNVNKTNGFGIKNGEGLSDISFFVYKQGGYVKMGQFNTEYTRLDSLDASQLVNNYQNKMSTCLGACLQCQYMFMMQNRYYKMGDWIIAATFSVSNPGPVNLQPYLCGTVRSANGPQFTTAMLYALQQVNSGKAPVSVKGVNFGSIILDHCNNPGRANLLVSNLYAGFLGDNTLDLDPSQILAWLTDNTDSSEAAAEFLEPLNVAVVSPGATSAGLLQYPNFFRTVQGDTTVTTAIAELIKYLGYQYVQVVYSASTYGRSGLETMTAVAQAKGICVTNSIEMTNSSSDALMKVLAAETRIVILFFGNTDTEAFLQAVANNDEARRSLLIVMPEPYTKIVETYSSRLTNQIISLQLQRFTLNNYTAYINNSPVDNPYFAWYYMSLRQCNLPGYSMYSSMCSFPLAPITQATGYAEDNFILSTINAVYAVVDAWDRTVKEFCGLNYTMPCAAFLEASNKREKFNSYLNFVSFFDDGKQTFKFLRREGNTGYDILQSTANGAYKKVGSYAGVSLNLIDGSLTRYSNISSLCSSPCLLCIMRGLNFSHIPGDIYLAGMFDVHERYLSPFTCGKIQTLHGFLLLEAFNYAINQVNNKQGQFADILRGVRLGGVGLDACGSQVRGGYLVSNIHSGLATLNQDGVIVAPSKIDAYIGSYDSTASLYLARILTDLEIPQISYASGSEDLSDTRIYPWFFRTVPSDNQQVEAMLKVLDQLNIRYVQILYEDNSNGISPKDYFVENAERYHICVAQTVSYPDLGTVNMEISNAKVAKLIEKPAANTIVTFLSTSYINSLLMAVGRSDRAKNKLRFVGSDAWANNKDAILGAENEAKGSITVKLDSDDVDEFEREINSKNLANSGVNPWFVEYYQEILKCYVSKYDTMGYTKPCPSAPSSIINSPGYQQDPGVVYVINAVYAAVFAMHETLKVKCGVNYNTVCQSYLNDVDHRAMILSNLINVKFMDPVGNEFMFVNRSGMANFRFSSIEPGVLSGIAYKEIGVYNSTTGNVNLTNTYTSNWDSDCDRKDACSECPAIRDRGRRYDLLKVSSPQDPAIVAFFDIHKQGVDHYRCGDINVQGFQQFLSFIYTLEQIKNNMQSNYNLLVIDTCSNSLRLDQDLYGLLDGTGICNTQFNNTGSPISLKNLASVITVGELNTIAASRVLEMPGVTYLSPDALTPLLDDKMYLVRSIAPSSAMMKTLVALLKKMGWMYVDVVYDDSPEGIYPYQKFAFYANLNLVCRGSNLMISNDMSDEDARDLLTQLNGYKGSKAVILLGNADFVARVLIFASSLGIADDYVWVLGATWHVSDTALMKMIPADVDIRLIVVQRKMPTGSNFDNYLKNLGYAGIRIAGSTSVIHEWYDEFYQMVFGCTLSSAVRPINLDKPHCNTTKTFKELEMMQDPYVLNTIVATYTALDVLSSNLMSLSRMAIRSSYLNVTWDLDQLKLTGGDFRVSYDHSDRWWDQGYSIRFYNLKKDSDGMFTTNTNSELYSGSYDLAQLKLELVQGYLKNVSSMCLEGTSIGACGCYYQDVGQPLPFTENRYPAEHRNYFKYNDKGEQVYDWPVWAITVAVLTSVGLLVTVILFLVLLIAYPKKGGTSILGYMVIFGIIGIYVINFAFFVSASNATCGARRFLMGVVYMIAIAPMLIKAIDNWRFGNYDKKKYKGITSFWVLFLTAVAVVLIQCIIPIIWLILVHPTASYWAPLGDSFHDNWWCDPVDEYDVGLVQSFIFVMFIILVTGIFSALGYDLERNNYESRWILFACICTAGCFVVWMIVSTNAGPPYRDAAVTIGNLVNATLLLLLMPLRKTILLCRALHEKEEKENEGEVMNGAAYGYDPTSYDNATFELEPYDYRPSEF